MAFWTIQKAPPSSPRMWPHPPHLKFLPSGLTSKELDPVPENVSSHCYMNALSTNALVSYDVRCSAGVVKKAIACFQNKHHRKLAPFCFTFLLHLWTACKIHAKKRFLAKGVWKPFLWLLTVCITQLKSLACVLKLWLFELKNGNVNLLKLRNVAHICS